MSPLPTGYVSPLAKTTVGGRQRVLTGIRLNSWVDPVAGAVDNFINTGVACPNASSASYSPGDSDWDGAVSTGIPDFPRCIQVNITHGSSIVACNGVVSGYDINDKAITDTWAVTATGTTKTATTNKAFKRVTSISVIAATDASLNTMKAGVSDTFGLDTICASVVPVAEEEDGAAPTAGTVVAGSSSGDQFGTYAPNSTPDGGNDYDLWYLTDDVQGSD